MVIIKMFCGIGNELFMYAFAKKLQKDLQMKEICLDYSEYHLNEFGKPLKPKEQMIPFEKGLGSLNLPDHPIIRTKEQFMDLTGAQGEKFLKLKKKLNFALKYGTKVSRYYIERLHQYEWNKSGIFLARNSYMEVFPEAVETENVIAQGYWQSERYFHSVADELRKEFAVSRLPLTDKNRLVLLLIENSESVCVHIRRGDYVRNGKTDCPDVYYETGKKYMEQQLEHPRFFVFSDEIAYAKKLQFWPSDTVFVDFNSFAIEDFRLMCACKHFVISNSTFSWWAQYLSDHQGKIVVAPRPWSRKFPSDLEQLNWHTISVFDVGKGK